MRLTAFLLSAALVVASSLQADEAGAPPRRYTSIRAQSLEAALEALAKERGFQILYRSAVVRSIQTNGATGDLTLHEALQRLLSDTGLRYVQLDAGAVTIVPIAGLLPQQVDPDSLMRPPLLAPNIVAPGGTKP